MTDRREDPPAPPPEADRPIGRNARDAARSADARRDLDRLASQSELLGHSAFVKAANRARDHFTAREAAHERDAADDPAEIWGRRIARILALAFVVGLVIHLTRTYLMA